MLLTFYKKYLKTVPNSKETYHELHEFRCLLSILYAFSQNLSRTSRTAAVYSASDTSADRWTSNNYCLFAISVISEVSNEVEVTVGVLIKE